MNDLITFGAYRLYPSRRLLLRENETVKLGGRAFDLLRVLAERPGEVIPQKELIESAWPGVFLEEVSLRVHIAHLRKTLEGAERYLLNIPGRGYSLVWPTSRTTIEEAVASESVSQATYALPSPPERMVGRADLVIDLCRGLKSERFVTLVGPGGVGKTTVALSVAYALLNEFKGAACFVELSPVGDPQLLAAAVTSAFQLPVLGEDPLPQLIEHLRDKRILLVLDSCEHLIDDVARLAQRLFDEAEGVHILATSREALRVEGEHVRRLPPLESPPEDDALSADKAREYPAIQLFINRLARVGPADEIGDEDVRIISQMCRQLGGLALAIELVAGRAAMFGVRDTASRLDGQFALTWPGRRTAPLRQQTLNATLDWSYNLLSDNERMVLSRLSVFASSFTFDAAQAVGRGDLGDEPIFDAISGLIAKSLISTDPAGSAGRYRLLDTTRAYARAKLEEVGERAAARRRHAVYYRELLRATSIDEIKPDKPTATVIDLDDIRVALQWAFDADGDTLLGADLAAYSAALWLGRALLAEARGWMAKAAKVCIDGGAADEQQLRIQIAFASTELFTSGFTEATLAVWKTTLDRAVALGDLQAQLLSYLVLWGGEIRAAWYVDALATAEKCAARVHDVSDPGPQAMAQWMLGHSKHHVALFEEAHAHLRRYLDLETDLARFESIKATGNDRHVVALGVLSNVFWILGLPDHAKVWGERAVADARALGFAIPIGLALSWAGLNTYLMEPDIDVIERDMIELLEQGRAHSIDSDAGFALCVMGICQAKRGQFDEAAALVEEGLRTLTRARMEVFSTLIRAHICEAAVEAGRLGEAVSWMEQLQSQDWNRDHWCSAEVLRVQGLLAQAQGDDSAAADLMSDAMALAKRQGALSWELRSALSLSKLRLRQGRGLEALEAVYDRFTEGRRTADLIAAKALIDQSRT